MMATTPRQAISLSDSEETSIIVKGNQWQPAPVMGHRWQPDSLSGPEFQTLPVNTQDLCRPMMATRMWRQLGCTDGERLEQFAEHVKQSGISEMEALLRHTETWFEEPVRRFVALRYVRDRLSMGAADSPLFRSCEQALVRILARHGRSVRSAFNIAGVARNAVDAELGTCAQLRQLYLATVHASLDFWGVWRVVAKVFPRWGFEEAMRFLRDAVRADLKCKNPSRVIASLEASLDCLEQLVKLADVQVRLGMVMERFRYETGGPSALSTRAVMAALVGMGKQPPIPVETICDRMNLDHGLQRKNFASSLKRIVSQLPKSALS